MKKNRIENSRLRTGAAALAILCAVLLLFGCLAAILRQGYVRRINGELAALAETVLKVAPELGEAELMAIFEGEREAKTPGSGPDLFEKYGCDPESVYTKSVRSYTAYLAALGAFSALLCGVLLTGWFLHEKKRGEDGIEELIGYMEAVRRGTGRILPEENSENALSRLKNELYKMTVLLRETSERSIRERDDLRRALEDISHQIKTPITSMRIMLDAMEESPEMDQETRMDFLRMVSSQIEHISALVIALLNMAKFDSGTIVLHPKAIRAGELVRDAAKELEILMEVRGVGLKVTGDTEAVFEADPRWQTEAVRNILKNCTEHSPAGSVIHVRAEDSALFLKLTIRDEGEGIRKEDLRHIFERFYKAENAGPDSIGIGLAFAKAVIEKEGGMITADSEEGKGSIFTIRYRK